MMPNRALKVDDTHFLLPGLDQAGDGLAVAQAESAEGTSMSGNRQVQEALAVEPLAGEEAMVRAFNQLRAAVRDAERERPPAERPVATAAPASPTSPSSPEAAAEVAVLQGGPEAAREDALFAFQAGSGSQFVSGGAGWADVVRLAGVDAPPAADGWNLFLESGTATEVDRAILLSEDAVGSLRLPDGSELAFEGIERIEW